MTSRRHAAVLRPWVLLTATACAAPGCRRASAGAGATAAPVALVNGAAPALPAVAGPPAPGRCTPGPRRVLETNGQRLLGVWRDGVGGDVRVATVVGPGRVAVSRLDPASGALQSETTVALPPGATARAAWRSHAGDVLIAYQTDAGPGLARVTSGGALSENDLARYGTNSGLGRVLGPLDDPSASRRAGLLLVDPARPAFASGSTVCEVDTATYAFGRCNTFWNSPWLEGSDLRRTRTEGVGGVQLSIQIAMNYRPGNARVQVLRGPTGSASQVPLGRSGGSNSRSYPYTPRETDADTTRSAPMIAFAPAAGRGLAMWLERSRFVDVQRLDGSGQPQGEPMSLPLVEPLLADLAAQADGTVVATITTRADETATPRTTTVVRFDLSGPDGLSLVEPPFRVPVAAARIVPLPESALWFWSAGDEPAGLLARCGPGGDDGRPAAGSDAGLL